MTILVLDFQKTENDDKTKYETCYSDLKAKAINSKSGIDDVFESIHSIITSTIQNSVGKISGWTTDHNHRSKYSFSKNKPLTGSSYIKLPKELNHPKKVWLIFKILIIKNALNGV